MPKDDHDDFEDCDQSHKSKTQVKKEMFALRDLGISLTKLNHEHLAKIPLSDSLRNTIQETPKIKGNSAKKRHMQYIGKLMRSANIEEVSRAYQALMNETHRSAQQHHQVENWRDRLLQEGKPAMEAFIENFPDTDSQQLGQLIRAAREEQNTQKPINTRKLFRFIREILAES